MYVTRPLSMYITSPSSLSLPPPEGPNSGILVIQDEEAEPTCCFGLCKSSHLLELPFPQNKRLIVSFGDNYKRVVLIPVLNQPLSSNQYYAIRPRGMHKGKAITSSKEEDETTCCLCNCISDRNPQPFDPNNIFQQFEICRRDVSGFFAKSVAPDGYPPIFLKRKGWRMIARSHHNFELGEAAGLDATLRSRLPDFNFPLSSKTSKPVVVGKWYCPFMFVKEATPKQQISRSMYYEMTLEQRWEQIFACENSHNRENVVVVDVDVVVQTEVVSLAGTEVVPEKKNVVDGVMWFRSSSKERGERSVGLSVLITERMKWEQERFGWDGENEKQVSVKRAEEFAGDGEWRKFGCYVLVERFVLKRMDGILVLTYDYKHTNQIRSKWE